MPEGPEVWILSEAINKYYHCEKTRAYGKHLFIIKDTNFGSTFSKQSDVVSGGINWSFGLTGKVQILDDNSIIKLETGWIYGDQTQFNDYDEETRKLGTNWLTSSEADLHKVVDSWIKSKKKLAGLILDQTRISGIGVAWGSEILYKANLRPDMRTCDQNLSILSDSILYIRQKIKNIYEKELKANNDSSKDFVNEWFSNLYEIREMEIYKKGSGLSVLGRTWWV
jgi:formamidopyrimidine-DNA glycosylase